LYYFYGSEIEENKDLALKFPSNDEFNKTDMSAYDATVRTSGSSIISIRNENSIDNSNNNSATDNDNIYDLISLKQFIYDVLNYADLFVFLTKQESPLLHQIGKMSEHASSNL
jgi:hypothetical protein